MKVLLPTVDAEGLQKSWKLKDVITPSFKVVLGSDYTRTVLTKLYGQPDGFL